MAGINNYISISQGSDNFVITEEASKGGNCITALFLLLGSNWQIWIQLTPSTASFPRVMRGHEIVWISLICLLSCLCVFVCVCLLALRSYQDGY